MRGNIIVFSSAAGESLASTFANAVCGEFPHISVFATPIPNKATATDWEAIQGNQPGAVCIVWDSYLRAQVQSLAGGLRLVNPELPIVILCDAASLKEKVLPIKHGKIHVLVYPWRSDCLTQLLGPHLRCEIFTPETAPRQANQ